MKIWVPLLLLVALLAPVGCGSSSSSDDGRFTGNAYPGVDLGNRRDAETEIIADDVRYLKQSWTLPINGRSAYGSYPSTPVVADGIVYSQDLESNVQAIDMETGKVLWTQQLESPGHRSNGLAVAEGRVYGTTDSEAFALDQESGEVLWSTPLGGTVRMQPGTDDGRVYVSTVPETPSGEYEAGAVGTLWAMDGKTGKKLWHFDTVPKNLWGEPNVNSGGGVRYPPSFDREGNVYVGTGSPAPLPGVAGHPWGSSRPGRNLYADSMVKLDPESGRVIWAYQQTPHDVYGWDFQDPPVLVKVDGRELAIGAGGSGSVVALDAKTGKPVWKRRVGTHNGHDEDPLYAMRGEFGRIKPGVVSPGRSGGVIGPLATDGKRVFVPIVNHPMVVRSGSEIREEGGVTGEAVSLDLKTGRVLWSNPYQAPVGGAPIVANDVVLIATTDGVVHVTGAHSGGEKLQIPLPGGTNAGVMASGDTLLADIGLPARGQAPKLVAYRLRPP
jgi:outer membrane protein assembly factor BamB